MLGSKPDEQFAMDVVGGVRQHDQAAVRHARKCHDGALNVGRGVLDPLQGTRQSRDLRRKILKIHAILVTKIVLDRIR